MYYTGNVEEPMRGERFHSVLIQASELAGFSPIFLVTQHCSKVPAPKTCLDHGVAPSDWSRGSMLEAYDKVADKGRSLDSMKLQQAA